jgi:hypothetical protein
LQITDQSLKRISDYLEKKNTLLTRDFSDAVKYTPTFSLDISAPSVTCGIMRTEQKSAFLTPYQRNFHVASRNEFKWRSGCSLPSWREDQLQNQLHYLPQNIVAINVLCRRKVSGDATAASSLDHFCILFNITYNIHTSSELSTRCQISSGKIAESADQQLPLVRNILSAVCGTYMIAAVEPPKCEVGENLIDNLPEEMLCEILSFLSPPELSRCGIVSKRWR